MSLASIDEASDSIDCSMNFSAISDKLIEIAYILMIEYQELHRIYQQNIGLVVPLTLQ